MSPTIAARFSSAARHDLFRFVDSYASLLVLLLANFFLLELVDDPRWGAIGSTLLSALALIVAISDPASGHTISRSALLLVVACVALTPLVLLIDSASVVGLIYLLPAALLVTATLPITLNRVLAPRPRHVRDGTRRPLHLRPRRAPVRVHLPRGERIQKRAFFAQAGPHSSRNSSTSASSR